MNDEMDHGIDGGGDDGFGDGVSGGGGEPDVDAGESVDVSALSARRSDLCSVVRNALESRPSSSEPVTCPVPECGDDDAAEVIAAHISYLERVVPLLDRPDACRSQINEAHRVMLDSIA